MLDSLAAINEEIQPKRMTPVFKQFATRKVAIAFAAIHVLWFCAAVFSLGHRRDPAISFLPGGLSSQTLFAGKPFHYEYAPPLFKVLLLLDAPALLISAFADHAFALLGLGTSLYTISYLDASLLLCFGSLQWFIFGRLLARWLNSRTRRG